MSNKSESLHLAMFMYLEALIFNQPIFPGLSQFCLPGRDAFWQADIGINSGFAGNQPSPNRVDLTEWIR